MAYTYPLANYFDTYFQLPDWRSSPENEDYGLRLNSFFLVGVSPWALSPRTTGLQCTKRITTHVSVLRLWTGPGPNCPSLAQRHFWGLRSADRARKTDLEIGQRPRRRAGQSGPPNFFNEEVWYVQIFFCAFLSKLVHDVTLAYPCLLPPLASIHCLFTH